MGSSLGLKTGPGTGRGGAIPVESNASDITFAVTSLEAARWKELAGLRWERQVLRAKLRPLCPPAPGCLLGCQLASPQVRHPHQACECGLILSPLYSCGLRDCVYSCTCVHTHTFTHHLSEEQLATSRPGVTQLPTPGKHTQVPIHQATNTPRPHCPLRTARLSLAFEALLLRCPWRERSARLQPLPGVPVTFSLVTVMRVGGVPCCRTT